MHTKFSVQCFCASLQGAITNDTNISKIMCIYIYIVKFNTLYHSSKFSLYPK